MRRVLVKVHLWLGLSIGLLWAIQGLTGAAFVFSRELDRAFLPVPSGKPMVDPDIILAAAKAVAPDGVVTRLSVNDRFLDSVNVLYTDPAGIKRAVIVDAGTARVLGRREMEPWTPFTGSASRWLYTLHLSLLAGDRGMILVGVSGLVLLTGAVTGLVIGWPRRRAWRQALSWRKWRKTEHKLFGWHRLAGLFAGFAFLVMGATGAFLALPEEPIRQFVARFVPYEQAFTPAMMQHMDMPVAPAARAIGPGEAVRIAHARFPTSHWMRIFMPSAMMPTYIVRLSQPGDIRAWLGTSEVKIDAGSGQVIGVYDAIGAPISNKAFDATFDVHSGAIAGWPGRILVFLAGLALPTLYTTGVWGWLDKRRRKAARVGRSATSARSAAEPMPAS